MMKHLRNLILLCGLLCGGGGYASASSTGTITVTITPNAFYSVTIDTQSVNMNLGTVDLGASTQTVNPSTVTIESTFATTDLKIQGSISSSGSAWSFDSNSATVEADSLAVWTTFTTTARSSAPTQTDDYFSGTVPGAASSDMVDSNDRYIGSSAGDSTTDLFENGSGFDAKDMDALAPDPAPAGKSHMWMYFRLPHATTTQDAQEITFTITAVAPD